MSTTTTTAAAGLATAVASNHAAVVEGRSYRDAIFHLNNLQSNQSVLKDIREQRARNQAINLDDMRHFLSVVGIQLDDIDALNVVHVSGTKGKGSTCAFTECILRRHGYKTGFYSSPHLMHATERIRLNGSPISQQLFAKYFFEVFDKIANEPLKPAYFKFLTLLAFHVFIREKVDVAVIEVGIGGKFDCTNVVRHPRVCGITTLDIDHTNILGDTLPQIAAHKAGIMKPGVWAVTAPIADVEASEVVRSVARKTGSRLVTAPAFEDYGLVEADLGDVIPAEHQKTNLSVAFQLARLWLLQQGRKPDFETLRPAESTGDLPGAEIDAFQPPTSFIEGAKTFSWPGRCQVLPYSSRVTFYLDGAHTPLSIEKCAAWFAKCRSSGPEEALRIIIYACTGDRSPARLLPPLLALGFDHALLSTTMLTTRLDTGADNTNLNTSVDGQLATLARCADFFAAESPTTACSTFPCIASTFERLAAIVAEHPDRPVQVLVTGSLHLVGGVLTTLDQTKPNLT